MRRIDKGAGIKRARYNSSIIDANVTESGDQYVSVRGKKIADKIVASKNNASKESEEKDGIFWKTFI